MKAEPVYYFEDCVAEQLGFSRDDIRYVRREILKRGVGWDILSGKIALSESGFTAVLERVRKTINDIPDEVDFDGCRLKTAFEKKETAGELFDLTVVRLLPNPRLLMASNGTEREVRVHVKNNQNFRPRMTLKGHALPDGSYQQEGRCPRAPGRY